VPLRINFGNSIMQTMAHCFLMNLENCLYRFKQNCRVLQDGIIEPVDSDRPHKVDVRIIAATNKGLKKVIKEGHFREDLFLSCLTY